MNTNPSLRGFFHPALRKSLPALLAFIGAMLPAGAQIAFKHTVTSATTSSALNDSSLVSAPGRIVLVTHDFGSLGPYVSNPVSVNYSGGWRLETQNGTNLPANAVFNVLSAPPGDNAFVHLTSSTNTSAHITTLDSPMLNGNPDARVFATPVGSTNPHYYGVFYTSGRWKIFNQDFATMPLNARFNIFIDDRAFVAEATAPSGNNFITDHASVNGKPAAVVFSTPLWTSVYNNNPTGVWYTSNRWRIYNDALASMPTGAKFNVLALSAGDNTEYPPVTTRSAIYDGVDSGVQYAASTRFNPMTAITLEAWVYRNGGSACETFISNSFSGPTGSYWLGVCPNLRFYRSGGTSADSTATIPHFKWTHVAVSYDGSTARFYVNGAAAGVVALGNAGTGGNHPLTIGRDATGFPFKGHLDEIRIWQGTRTQSQIQQGMWQEIRDASNLSAVFDTGGRREVIGDLTGTAQPILPKESGLGILPDALLVPRARYGVTVNGVLDRFYEYVGAERFVIRNPDSRADESGYLIHDGSRLYVAMENVAYPDGTLTPDQSFCSVHLDPDNSGGSFATTTDLRLLQTLGTIKRLDTGNNLGGFQASGETTGWSAAKDGGTSEFAAANMEFSILLSRLATGPATASQALTETDRFAFVQTGVHSTSDRFSWPGDAAYNSPNTWAPLTYSTTSSGPPLPVGFFRCRVVEAATGAPLSGRTVRLVSTSGLVYSTYLTDADGDLYFSREVPAIPLRLQVVLTSGEIAETPAVTVDYSGPAPTFFGNDAAVFPACTFGACTFDKVEFRVRVPVGTTTITGADPSITAPLTVRAGTSPKRHPTGQATLTGSNIHSLLEVYLALRTTTPLTTPLNGLVEGTDYWRATMVSDDAGSAVFECPDVPLNRRPGNYIIVVKDPWVRPANSTTSWKIGPVITINNPPYPLVHGFEFENIGDGHDIDDYRAAFPDQVCDPFHMVGFWAFFPVYKLILDGGGECYGVSITSQQFSKGLNPAGYRSDVLFANGFPSHPESRLVNRPEGPAMRTFQVSELPATFNVSNPCSPSPTNVWGQVRAWHGIQLSSEAIRETLSQFEVRFGSVITDMTDALALMAPNPRNYHLCIRDGDKGHCVQPLRIINEVRDEAGAIIPNARKIEIYDPNWPQVTQVIDIDLGANRYTYNGFSTPWSGRWMPIYRTDPLVAGGRHVPSVDILGSAVDHIGARGLFELLQMIVAGDADMMATSPDGQLGWDAAGNFVETSTETWPIPLFNWSDNIVPEHGHYPVNMIHRLGSATPSVSIRTKGTSYAFHGSHNGTIFQTFVDSAVAGQEDALAFTRSAHLVDGISLTPQSTRSAKILIGLCRNHADYPCAISFDGLTIPAGTSATMRALPRAAGIEFLNDTGLEQIPTIELALPTAQGTEGPLLKSPPGFSLPSGSTFRFRSVDGYDYTQFYAELDEDRDGQIDRRWIFNAQTNLLAEVFGPLPGEIPVLNLAFTPNGGFLSWQDQTGWILTSSPDLIDWSTEPEFQASEGDAYYFFNKETLGDTRYFRLEKRF